MKRDCPVGSKKTAKVKGKAGNEAAKVAAKKGSESQQQKGAPATRSQW